MLHSVWNQWASAGVLVLVRVKIPRAVASCPSSRLRQRSVKPSTSPKVNSWRAGLYIIAIFVSVKSDFRGKKGADHCRWNFREDAVYEIISVVALPQFIHWWRVRTLEACLSLLLKKPLQLSRIQIMGHLINLHTKHPHLMTQSCMDQSYVYMHAKAGT